MANIFTIISFTLKKAVFDNLNELLSYRNIAFQTYNFHNTREIFQKVKKIKKNIGLEMTTPEGVQIFLVAESSNTMKGDIAEVGVYKGGSAAIIAEAVSPKKTIHLFDTFEGLPDTNKHDKAFTKGQYKETITEVKSNLKKYKNLKYYPGLFPDTGGPIQNKKFSFVHLDVDLYQGTFDCLQFFYPRLVSGGRILIHDFPQPGVKKAIDDFLKDKEERYIVLTGPQCLIIKQ